MFKTYRVIQWATGTVGKTTLKHFIENPVLELVGVYVTNPEKVGKDAGDLVGLAPTGVLATSDAEAIVALEADCVLFAPIIIDVAMICRLLRSGKNVISPAGPFVPNAEFAALGDEIAAACRDGGTSYHGCGIHPGFAGDLMPLTLARLMNRIDGIEVTEIIDKLRNPMIYTEIMGFGRDPEALLAKPSRSPDAPRHFYSSMAMVVEGLGKTIEKVTTELEVAKATQDIPYDTGVIKQGMVGGQHFTWTAWVEGAPFLAYHFYWTMGEHLDPLWDNGDSCYRIRMRGDPAMEVKLTAMPAADGRTPFFGLLWTGLLGATAVPAVCQAAPGLVTHAELGIVTPRGLVRS